MADVDTPNMYWTFNDTLGIDYGTEGCDITPA